MGFVTSNKLTLMVLIFGLLKLSVAILFKKYYEQLDFVCLTGPMLLLFSFMQAGLIETNGELKVFIDQNLSPSKGTCVNNV